MGGVWRIEIVNGPDGTWKCSAPAATLKPIDLDAMEVEVIQFDVPVDSPAGRAIIAAPKLPLLEVQVWRDQVDDDGQVLATRCVTAGPIITAPVDFTGTIPVTAHGTLEHFDRTYTGPPAMPNLAPNPLFATDLDGWGSYRTTLVPFGDTELVDFLDPAGYIEWAESGVSGAPNAPIAGANWVKFNGDLLTEDEALQVFKDLTISSSTIAPIRVTIRAASWIPPGQTFGPPDPGEAGRTNLDHALIATLHDPDGDFDPDFPIGYFQLTSVLSVTRWDDIYAGRYRDLECTVEIPQDTGDWLVHLAMSSPRLVTYFTLVEITVDHPLDLDGTDTGRAGDLIAHAQDPAFDHKDRRIVGELVGAASTVVDEEPIMESDRRSVLQYFDQAQQAGRLEWRTRHDETGTILEYGMPPLGAQKPHPIVITTEGGPGHVASGLLDRMWANGSTSVTGQSSNGQARSDVAAVVVDDELGWEEVLVAPNHIERWHLPGWTEAQLEEVSNPDALDITFKAGDAAAEPWRDGTIRVLDRVEVNITLDGVDLSGWWQVRSITHDPATDGVAATLVPDVTG